MAFTERYVTQAAGGGGDGSSGTPWTLAEAFANATAGDRVNIQSDSGYSIGATTLTNAGTAVAPVIYRGYNSTIGDLDDQGRNADGTLNTSNFPAITVTGTLVLQNHNVFQNLNISGALSSELLGGIAADIVYILNCNIVNTQNNASARCVLFDDSPTLVNSDFECSGASHGTVVEADYPGYVHACRFKCAADSHLLECFSIQATECTFIGNSNGTGVANQQNPSTTRPHWVTNCTFYNLATAIEITANSPAWAVHVFNNHVTDCSKYLDNTQAGTSDVLVLEFHNRLRDNTTPRTGIESIAVGEEATDTGGASTDYNDAGTGDLTLISAAPGKGAGINGGDCGAWPAAESGGGGGTGGWVIGGS